MPKGNFKSISIKKEIYEKVLSIGRSLERVQSFSDALEVLTPSYCIEGLNYGGHIIVNIEIGRIILEGIMSIKLGEDLLIPISDIDKLFSQLFSDNPIARLFLELMTLYAVIQSKAVTATRLSFDVNAQQAFLIDTGATMTVINTDKLPKDIKDHLLWSINRSKVSTANKTINLPQGKVRLRVKEIDKTIETPALFLSSGSSQYHLLGITSLVQLLGPRVLFDFAHGKICVY